MLATKYVEKVHALFNLLQVDKFLEVLGPETLNLNQAAKNLSAEDRKKFGEIITAVTYGLVNLPKDQDMAGIFKSLKLEGFFNAEFLYSLQTTYRTQPNTHNIGGNEDFKRFVLTLQNLKQYVGSLAEYFLDTRRREETPEKEILQFLVMEPGAHIDAERLIKALQVLSVLYATVAEILNQQERSPKIAFLDSGSDSLLGFLSPKEIAECIKSLVLEFWNKIKYANNDQSDRNMDSIIKTLDVVQRVDEMQKSGALDGEAASRLKHKLSESCIGLVSNGVMLREVVEAETETKQNRKLLEDKRQLLLEAPKETKDG